MMKYEIPARLLAVSKAFHTDMRSTVTINGETSDLFQVLHGVKQGYTPTPTLFALFLAAVRQLIGRKIHSNSVGQGLFNLSRLKSQCHVLVKRIRELDADDSVLVSHTLDGIQRLLENFAKAASNHGMTINIKKTEVLYQPVSG